MPFVAENGNGLEDANAYASVSNFRDFASLRGIALPNDDEKLQGALIVATDWISNNYTQYWLGFKSFAQQALDWPRNGLVDKETGQAFPLGYYPPELIKATCTLAVEALKGALYTNVSGASPQILEDTIGPITTKYKATDPSVVTAQRNFDEVRQILTPLTRGIFGSLRTSR